MQIPALPLTEPRQPRGFFRSKPLTEGYQQTKDGQDDRGVLARHAGVKCHTASMTLPAYNVN